MATRYDIYRFNTDVSDGPLDSDVLYSVGMQIGEYTCPYATLAATGNPSSPYTSAACGDRIVNVTRIRGYVFYFNTTTDTIDPAGKPQQEFMEPVIGEEGFYGSYKRCRRYYSERTPPNQWRTSIFVPSALGLSVNQVWAIMQTYLADPTNPGCK